MGAELGVALKSFAGAPDGAVVRGKAPGNAAAHMQGCRWYVAAVQPGREDAVEVHLARQGFVSFAPRRLKTVKHARRLTERKVPLFPGYVFVSLDLDLQRWRSVNGTFGVRSLVTAGDRPSPVPRGLVESFIDLTDMSGTMNAGPDLTPGQRVQVLTGPFADFIGTIERLDSNGRVRVLLGMLNGESPVTMDRNLLWPAA
ncbi:MAG: transcription termination/antitermination NusG family protein [Parvibaculum sp.]|uniref:transcription termination/antitermination protein NusG n=1 Tax=Parvibaculum sp. TaxID=2024848 RepID=UPI0027276FB8|nr:transcription termination/antitermination NusG family protein [Parvibaculum sp.]MDO8837353.1 transcription termination/antitermination NusG family protein [Parvibaculum sp.]